ncbi:LPXTG cell wall anchor domain-containing protein [Micromonospora sp. NBC_01638]|uniref:LPXTG cell wall anchor domain-containing protein n=1 Tax=Micromonospora sp. NBC_01638 TaxID=2975982 RepID=UPI003864DBF7|nr:LPXTG cell wall anchor domain-containing protein [Micromonospora sp. NBC_01638]
MLTHSTRRWLAGLGVAGAFVAASASPAVANEEAPVELGIYFGDTTIATKSAGKVESTTAYSSAPVVLRDVTVRYDYRDLVDKITIATETATGYCTVPEKGVLLCADPFEIGVEEWGLGGIAPVVIAPTEGAKDGDAGTVKVTLSAAGFDSVSHDAKIRVGEGVDLAAGPEIEMSAAPGGKFTAALKVSNSGKTAANGASVIFYNDYGIRADKHYSNCTYVDDELRSCHFDEDLAAGATYGANLAYRLGEDSYAPGSEYGEIIWMTPAEFEDFDAYLDSVGVSVGKPGTDGKLALAKLPTMAGTRGSQADTVPDNNGSSLNVKVTGKNGTDLEAIGDHASGKKGDEVEVTIGFRNNGPATLDRSRGGSAVTHMNVEIPKNTSVVAAPEFCAPITGEEWGEPGQPGGRVYGCYPTPFIKAGDQETVDFTLRIDKVVQNDTGAVKINLPCECDGGFYADLKPANDAAKILINAAGGTGGGDNGDGGSLPITGQSTGLIAGLGALLLAAGVGGYLVAKRRRTRFVA